MAKIRTMATASKFVPELWSQVVIDEFKKNISIKRRSKGERLLRAAAQGASQEEIDKIDAEGDGFTTGELYDYIQKQWTADAADALAHSIDNDILSGLSSGP